MSILEILYPKTGTQKGLARILTGNGFNRVRPFFMSWNNARACYYWFDKLDFRSTVGVEAIIFNPSIDETRRYGCGNWALYTRTRVGASFYDRTKQNQVIRTARHQFKGTFWNDWYGTNRYTPLTRDEDGPVSRAIADAYQYVNWQLGAVRMSLPEELFTTNISQTTPKPVARLLQVSEPTRVLYSAVVPFLVAALEHFFRSSFIAMLRFDASARSRLNKESRRVDFADALKLASGEMLIEEIVSASYSFQSLEGIHNAFRDWFDIDFRGLMRTSSAGRKRYRILDDRLMSLIMFRHGVVHRFESDGDLSRVGVIDLIQTVEDCIEKFVTFLEDDRGIGVRHLHWT